jgi:hypothetical protein
VQHWHGGYCERLRRACIYKEERGEVGEGTVVAIARSVAGTCRTANGCGEPALTRTRAAMLDTAIADATASSAEVKGRTATDNIDRCLAKGAIASSDHALFLYNLARTIRCNCVPGSLAP